MENIINNRSMIEGGAVFEKYKKKLEVDTLLQVQDNLIVYQVAKQNLADFTKFVFNVYAKDYQQKYGWESSQDDLQYMLNEDEQYADESVFIAVKSLSGKIIATVRLSHKANPNIKFPIETEFGITVQDLYPEKGVKPNEIWHCGRLAIDKDIIKEENININTVKILKMLIYYIGDIAFQKSDNILVSESDHTSYKLMRALGFNMRIVGDGFDYLGSMTYPTMTSAKDYHAWYQNQKKG
jgi:hypothetical protein